MLNKQLQQGVILDLGGWVWANISPQKSMLW